MRREGFSLVEISVVLVVVATMLAGVLPAITEGTKVKDTDTTADRLEGIEEAIQVYYNMNGSIPCPSDITLGVNTANFGVMAAGATCNGGTPDANFGPASNVTGGGVPTKTLGLPDEYAFDGWGRRIYYHVDTRATVASTFDTAGGISVDDATAGAPFRTTTAVYALVSAGRNGHGAYTRNGAVRANTGSVNADEINNCDTGGTVCGGAYNATLVQKLEAATNPNDPTTNFDDVVSYKLKGALVLGAKEGQSDTSQGLYASWSQSLASGSYVNITGMTTVNNDLPNSTFAGGTFTVGTGEDGWYTLSASAYGPNASDELIVAVLVNGTIRALDSGQTAAGASTASATTAFRLAAGDTVRVQVRQLTGATKVFTGTFSVARVSGSVNMGSGAGSSFWADAGSNHINSTNSGNVGIGTSAPTEKLTIGDYSARTAIGLYGLHSDPSSPGTDANGDRLIFYKNASWKTGIGFGTLNDLWVQSTGGTNDPGFRVFTGINAGGAPVERLRVRNDGNVGIGTIAPAFKLDVSGVVPTNYVARFSNTGTHGIVSYGNHYAVVGYNNDATNGGAVLGVNSVTGALGYLGSASNGSYGLAAGVGYGGYFQAPGNYGVYGRSTNAGYGGVLGYDAQGTYYGILGYANAYTLYGNGVTLSAGGFTTSDGRLKEDVHTIEKGDALSKVLQLHPVTYRWKKDAEQYAGEKGLQIGLIAQEAQKVIPELVREVETPTTPGIDVPSPTTPSSLSDVKGGVTPVAPAPTAPKRHQSLNQKLGKTLAVEYTDVVPYLIGAVQELNSKVDAVSPVTKVTGDTPAPTHSPVSSTIVELPRWLWIALVAPWLAIGAMALHMTRLRKLMRTGAVAPA